MVSERVIGGAFRVTDALGAGFLEKVYENALAHELREGRLAVVRQHRIVVRYDGVAVGECAVELLEESKVMAGLKLARALGEEHAAQCINYLKATGPRVCLLLNFAKPRLEIRRFKHGTGSGTMHLCASVVQIPSSSLLGAGARPARAWRRARRVQPPCPGCWSEAVPASRDLPHRCGRCRRGWSG